MFGTKVLHHRIKIKEYISENTRKITREEKRKLRQSRREMLKDKTRDVKTKYKVDDYLLREHYYSVPKFLKTLQEIEKKAENILAWIEVMQRGYWFLSDERTETIYCHQLFPNLVAEDIFIPIRNYVYSPIEPLLSANIFSTLAFILDDLLKSPILQTEEGQNLFSLLISFIGIFSSMSNFQEETPIDKDCLILYSFVNILKLESLANQRDMGSIFFYLGNVTSKSSHLAQILCELKYHEILANELKKIATSDWTALGIKRYILAVCWSAMQYYYNIDSLASLEDINITSTAIYSLIKTLDYQNNMCIEYCLKTLGTLSQPDSPFCSLILTYEPLFTRLAKFIDMYMEPEVITGLLSILTNASALGGQYTNILIENFKILDYIERTKDRVDVTGEILYMKILYNFSADGSDMIQTLIDQNQIATIINGISYGQLETAKYAVLILKNVSKKGTIEQLETFLEADPFNYFSSVLSYKQPEVYQICLDTLESFLEMGIKYDFYHTLLAIMRSTTIHYYLKQAVPSFCDNILLSQRLFKMIELLESKCQKNELAEDEQMYY